MNNYLCIFPIKFKIPWIIATSCFIIRLIDGDDYILKLRKLFLIACLSVSIYGAITVQHIMFLSFSLGIQRPIWI